MSLHDDYTIHVQHRDSGVVLRFEDSVGAHRHDQHLTHGEAAKLFRLLEQVVEP